MVAYSLFLYFFFISTKHIQLVALNTVWYIMLAGKEYKSYNTGIKQHTFVSQSNMKMK